MIEEHIEIHFATFDDAAEIADLSRISIENGLGWRWTAGTIKSAIENPSTNVIVAGSGHTLAGFGIMNYGDQKANLNLLSVKSEFRRKGIGTRIVRWLEQVADTAGIFHTYVQLREKNSVAKNFYLSLGYEIVDIVPGYYQDIESALIMYRYTGLIKSV